MKTFLIPFIGSLMAIALVCCCKDEPVTDPNTFFGLWHIEKTQKYIRNIGEHSSFFLCESASDTSTILFNKDSTGIFLSPLGYLTDTVRNFRWRHDLINGTLQFSLVNGTTIGLIDYFSVDSTGIYFRVYLSEPNGTASTFYYLNMKKITAN